MPFIPLDIEQGQQPQSGQSSSGFTPISIGGSDINQQNKIAKDVSRGVPPSVAAIADTARRIISQNTPEELVNEGFTPLEAASISTAQKMLSPVMSVGNAMLAGVPDIALSALGERRQPVQDLRLGGLNIAPAVNTLADVTGFVRGPLRGAESAIGAATPRAAGEGLLKAAGRGGAAFGLASAISTPQDEEVDNVKARMFRTVSGTVAGVVFGALGKGIENFTKAVENEVRVARAVRDSIKGEFKNRGANFEKGLYEKTLQSNNKLINIADDVDDLARQLAGTRKVAKRPSSINVISKRGIKSESAIRTKMTDINKIYGDKIGELARNSKNVQEVLLNPDRVSLKRLQLSINDINATVSKAKLEGKGLRASDQEIKGIINKFESIKAKQFPEMAEIDAAYAAASENLKMFENLKVGNTISSIKSAFNDPEKTQALQALLPRDIYNEAKQLVSTRALNKTAVNTLKEFIRYGILYQMLRKTIGNRVTGVAIGGDE